VSYFQSDARQVSKHHHKCTRESRIAATTSAADIFAFVGI